MPKDVLHRYFRGDSACHEAGRMNRNNCVPGLRLCAPPETVTRMRRVWERFPLPTQALYPDR